MQETHSIEIFQQQVCQKPPLPGGTAVCCGPAAALTRGAQVETISSMQHFTLQDLLDQIKEGLEVHMGVTPIKENLPWCPLPPAHPTPPRCPCMA